MLFSQLHYIYFWWQQTSDKTVKIKILYNNLFVFISFITSETKQNIMEYEVYVELPQWQEEFYMK